MFATYAYPPNELGYCGPPDPSVLLDGRGTDVAEHAQGFDGAWPYLEEIAAAAGIADPLDADVVRAYWVGGPLLDRVDAAALLDRLRHAMSGQPCGLLADVDARFARCWPTTASMCSSSTRGCGFSTPTRPPRCGSCSRAGSVGASSIPWTTNTPSSHRVRCVFDAGELRLGEPVDETVRWRSADGATLAPRPAQGATVAAHWDWVCGSLDGTDVDALAAATASTLEVVSRLRAR